MAAKVNTKFVAILSISIVAGAAAVGGTLWWILKNDASRLIRRGDEALAAGDIKAAEQAYSKAVNKKQTDAVLLKKWGDVLQQVIPDTQTEYSQKFSEYVNMLDKYAVLQGTDVSAHRAYLDSLYREVLFSRYDRGGHDNLINQAERALNFFGKGSPPINGNPDVLRRYKGIPRAAIIAQTPDQTDPKLAKETLDDLHAALAADPTDEQALNAIVIVQSATAATARKRSVDLEASEAIDAARKDIEEFLKAHPDSPAVMLSALELDLDEATRAAIYGKTGVAAMTAAKEKRASFTPRLDALTETILKVGPGKVEPNTLSRLLVAESIIDPAARRSRTERVMTDFTKAQPDNFFALQVLGDIQAERGNTTEAIATLQKIIDLPRRKLGVEGVLQQQLRPFIMGKQARFALLAWEKAKSADKAAALTTARDLVAKYKSAAGEDPRVQLMDAQLKFVEGDILSAQKLLQSYNSLVRDEDADGLWLQAQVMLRTNSSGATESLIEKVVRLQPGNENAQLALADVKLKLQKLLDARTICEHILEFNPDNKPARDMLNTIAAVQGTELKSSDPIQQTLADANRLILSEKRQEAIALLRKALVDSKNDVRITYFLAQQLNGSGDKPGALAVIDEAIAANPEASSALKVLRIAMSKSDPMEAEIAAIDTTPVADAIEKLIAKANSYRKYGRKEEAAQAIEEAARLKPDEPRVIELQFVSKLDAGKFDDCDKLAEKAVKLDLDRVQGRTFRARVLFGRGQKADAIALMQAAVNEFAISADSWRVLARMQADAARNNDALASYNKANEIRPDDVNIIIEKMLLLRNANRIDDALQFARISKKYGQNDRIFNDIYLDLEGQVGDKANALKEREALMARDPKNLPNRLAAAWLMLDLKEFDRARKLVDQLKAEFPDRVEVAILDARFLADKGDFVGARNSYATFLASISRDKLTSEPYVSFARLMMQYNQNDAAMATFEQARRFQDPKVMEADRMLADQATSLRRSDLAETYLRRIVAAGADTPEQTFTRRLVENLNSQGKFKDSRQFLSTIKSPVDKDVVLLLLSSDAERGNGDEKWAKELLDLAKANFGNDPRVWIKSAQANMARPEYAQDVIADLNRAIQIDSRNAQLFEIRGGYLVRSGKVNEGIEDLTKAVNLNPNLASLRMSLIRELLNRGRGTEALTIGEDAMKNRGNDIQLAIELADTYYDSKQYGYAAKFYKQAWELNKTPTLTLRYLDSMLSAQPPMLADAEKVLKDRQADIDKNLELRLSRAKLQWKRGRIDDARADLKAAIDLIQPDQTQQLVLWFNTLSQVYPRAAERARQLDQFERDTPASEIKDWILLLRAITFAEDPASRSQGLDLYKQLVERSKNPQLRLMGYQRWSVSHYSNKEFDAAATVMTKGVKEFPEDWELNNNLAFLLANELKRASDALPYAEKTVKLRPDNTDSLDTLGTTYLALGDLAQAEQNLRRALEMSGRLQGQFSAAVHLGKVMIAKKDRAGAELVLADIDKMSKSAGDALSEEQKKDIESLRTEIGSIQSR